MFLLLEVSSANISINGTRGDPLLWSCHYIFSEPFQPEQSLIFWQGYKKMDIVLHIYRKGQQEFHYQSQSFQNRTTVFPDQLPSGNFSLVIEPLMLQDNQIFIEVIFLSENKPTKKLCQTTVYVAGMMLNIFLLMANEKFAVSYIKLCSWTLLTLSPAKPSFH